VSEEQVLLSVDVDGVRTLTLNRPDRKNAIDPQLWTELHKLRRLTDVALALHELTIPTIAKVTGLAAGPPVALAQSKALLNDGANATLREALANEARAQPGNFATADSTEAYAAFADKREPVFTGRWAVAPRSE
jgi:enoyl-CoA hydratase/carnithine racemase